MLRAFNVLETGLRVTAEVGCCAKSGMTVCTKYGV